MTSVWLAFHLLITVLDALALGWIAKHRTQVVVPAVAWAVGVLFLAAFAGKVSHDTFAVFSVIGFGFLMHGPLVLVTAAWLTTGTRRKVLAGLAVPIALFTLDAYVVEPAWIVVTEVDIVVPDAPRALTVAVLADVQTDGVTSHERRAIELAMAANPDLILFPGDLVQHAEEDDYARTQEELRSVFRDGGLSAPLGVYAVDGNVDLQRPWTHVFDGLDVNSVEGDITRFEPEAGVHITAIPFYQGFDRDLTISDSPGLHIAFAHGPDFALGDIDADILVAGHTHGGQVQLPFIGPLITFSHVPNSWASGTTTLGPNKTLVVSRGIGMERHNAPRLRFLCRPEVVILHIRPE